MKNKRIIPIAVIIVLICAVAATALIYFKGKGKNRIETADASGSTEALEDIIDPNKHLVSFYSADDSLIETQQVGDGEDAISPADPIMPPGYILTGWDRSLTNITEDTAIHAVCVETTGKKNVLALSGTAGTNGSEVIVPLVLTGDVSIAGFDLTLTYDPKKLELKGITDDDGALIYNDEEPGKVRMNYVSVENTTGEVDLCRLHFTLLTDEGELPVKLDMSSAYVLVDDEKMEKAEFTLIDAVVKVEG